ncbi:MAG: hypothetical protein IT165_15250 [Bryobacterales bacterium]|nr:hypothetical protein [Bryobacterales bacterium]
MTRVNLKRGWKLFPSKRLEAALVVGLVAQLSIGSAASPVIGIVSAGGSFALETAAVPGNGTLFNGSMVETGKSTSELRLQNGVRLVLDTGTRSRVYRDHLVLEKGTGQVERGGAYRIEAGQLQIEPGQGLAKVSVMGPRVHVSALGGPVRVSNGSGVLIARLETGRGLDFEPQEAGASAPSTVSGCLVKKDGRLLLTDDTTGVTYEIQGTGLEKEIGKKVQVTGALDPSRAAELTVHATQIKRLSGHCSVTGAAAAAGGAAGGAAAGSSGGGSAGAAAGLAIGTKAVIAGVVVAGAATGTAVGLTRSDTPSISQ